MADLVHIKFSRRAPMGNVTYNAGEEAAFERHVADRILAAKAGVIIKPQTPEPPPEPAKTKPAS
jgi:hypothetical protein